MLTAIATWFLNHKKKPVTSKKNLKKMAIDDHADKSGPPLPRPPRPAHTYPAPPRPTRTHVDNSHLRPSPPPSPPPPNNNNPVPTPSHHPPPVGGLSGPGPSFSDRQARPPTRGGGRGGTEGGSAGGRGGEGGGVGGFRGPGTKSVH